MSDPHQSPSDSHAPDGSPWTAILDREGPGDQRSAVDELRLDERRQWQETLRRRDDAVAELELLRAERVERRPPPASADPPSALGRLDDDEVRYAAEIGRWIPQFEYYSPVRRWIAKLTSRFILFLTGFISVHQRRYNHLVLDKMAATQERLDALIESVDSLNARLAALEGPVDPEGSASSEDRGLEDRVSVDSAGVDALRREVHRLQCEVLSQAVEVADLQAERLGRRVRELDEL